MHRGRPNTAFGDGFGFQCNFRKGIRSGWRWGITPLQTHSSGPGTVTILVMAPLLFYELTTTIPMNHVAHCTGMWAMHNNDAARSR
ncbi:hypothetical protein [Pendulispora rubella]|uniref:hypothetical protein n=1 Tax=Pendulispora rubella TaxID=2741070 RepID=UPI0030E368F5